jgi:two-component system chemotaxis response regulator CheY
MFRILAVDDQAVTRKLVSMILKSKGCQVEDVESAQLALDRVEEQAYDLIVTDYRMPEMNGIELVKELKKVADTKHIPIIMITAEDSETLKNQAEGAGIDAWMPKPFKPNELLSVVERLLKNHSG